MDFDLTTAETFEEIKAALQKVSMIASQVKSLNETEDAAPEFLDLVQVTKSEIEDLHKSDSISKKEIKIQFQPETKTILTSLSRTEISRVLQNLIANAADASAHGSTIKIKLNERDSSSILTVEDQGHGIPLHLHEKVFEPDYTSKPSTGTGLGLFIVKHICEQKDGSVKLSSLPNIGTTVTISIPSIRGEGGLYAI